MAVGNSKFNIRLLLTGQQDVKQQIDSTFQNLNNQLRTAQSGAAALRQKLDAPFTNVKSLGREIDYLNTQLRIANDRVATLSKTKFDEIYATSQVQQLADSINRVTRQSVDLAVAVGDARSSLKVLFADLNTAGSIPLAQANNNADQLIAKIREMRKELRVFSEEDLTRAFSAPAGIGFSRNQASTIVGQSGQLALAGAEQDKLKEVTDSLSKLVQSYAADPRYGGRPGVRAADGTYAADFDPTKLTVGLSNVILELSQQLEAPISSISKAMAELAPTFAQGNIGYTQTAAFFAKGSQTGLSPEKTSLYLRNLYNNLASPNKAAIDAAEGGLGIKIGQEEIKRREALTPGAGFTSLVADLIEAAKVAQDPEIINKIIDTAQAKQVVSSATRASQDVEAIQKSGEFFKAVAAGDSKKTQVLADTVKNSDVGVLKDFLNTVRELSTELGSNIIKGFSATAQTLEPIGTAIKGLFDLLPEPVKNFLFALTGFTVTLGVGGIAFIALAARVNEVVQAFRLWKDASMEQARASKRQLEVQQQLISAAERQLELQRLQMAQDERMRQAKESELRATKERDAAMQRSTKLMQDLEVKAQPSSVRDQPGAPDVLGNARFGVGGTGATADSLRAVEERAAQARDQALADNDAAYQDRVRTTVQTLTEELDKANQAINDSMSAVRKAESDLAQLYEGRLNAIRNLVTAQNELNQVEVDLLELNGRVAESERKLAKAREQGVDLRANPVTGKGAEAYQNALRINDLEIQTLENELKQAGQVQSDANKSYQATLETVNKANTEIGLFDDQIRKASATLNTLSENVETNKGQAASLADQVFQAQRQADLERLDGIRKVQAAYRNTVDMAMREAQSISRPSALDLSKVYDSSQGMAALPGSPRFFLPGTAGNPTDPFNVPPSQGRVASDELANLLKALTTALGNTTQAVDAANVIAKTRARAAGQEVNTPASNPEILKAVALTEAKRTEAESRLNTLRSGSLTGPETVNQIRLLNTELEDLQTLVRGVDATPLDFSDAGVAKAITAVESLSERLKVLKAQITEFRRGALQSLTDNPATRAMAVQARREISGRTGAGDSVDVLNENAIQGSRRRAQEARAKQAQAQARQKAQRNRLGASDGFVLDPEFAPNPSLIQAQREEAAMRRQAVRDRRASQADARAKLRAQRLEGKSAARTQGYEQQVVQEFDDNVVKPTVSTIKGILQALDKLGRASFQAGVQLREAVNNAPESIQGMVMFMQAFSASFIEDINTVASVKRRMIEEAKAAINQAKADRQLRFATEGGSPISRFKQIAQTAKQDTLALKQAATVPSDIVQGVIEAMAAKYPGQATEIRKYMAQMIPAMLAMAFPPGSIAEGFADQFEVIGKVVMAQLRGQATLEQEMVRRAMSDGARMLGEAAGDYVDAIQSSAEKVSKVLDVTADLVAEDLGKLDDAARNSVNPRTRAPFTSGMDALRNAAIPDSVAGSDNTIVQAMVNTFQKLVLRAETTMEANLKERQARIAMERQGYAASAGKADAEIDRLLESIQGRAGRQEVDAAAVYDDEIDRIIAELQKFNAQRGEENLSTAIVKLTPAILALTDAVERRTVAVPESPRLLPGGLDPRALPGGAERLMLPPGRAGGALGPFMAQDDRNVQGEDLSQFLANQQRYAQAVNRASQESGEAFRKGALVMYDSSARLRNAANDSAESATKATMGIGERIKWMGKKFIDWSNDFADQVNRIGAYLPGLNNTNIGGRVTPGTDGRGSSLRQRFGGVAETALGNEGSLFMLQDFQQNTMAAKGAGLKGGSALAAGAAATGGAAVLGMAAGWSVGKIAELGGAMGTLFTESVGRNPFWAEIGTKVGIQMATELQDAKINERTEKVLTMDVYRALGRVNQTGNLSSEDRALFQRKAAEIEQMQKAGQSTEALDNKLKMFRDTLNGTRTATDLVTQAITRNNKASAQAASDRANRELRTAQVDQARTEAVFGESPDAKLNTLRKEQEAAEKGFALAKVDGTDPEKLAEKEIAMYKAVGAVRLQVEEMYMKQFTDNLEFREQVEQKFMKDATALKEQELRRIDQAVRSGQMSEQEAIKQTRDMELLYAQDVLESAIRNSQAKVLQQEAVLTQVKKGSAEERMAILAIKDAQLDAKIATENYKVTVEEAYVAAEEKARQYENSLVDLDLALGKITEKEANRRKFAMNPQNTAATQIEAANALRREAELEKEEKLFELSKRRRLMSEVDYAKAVLAITRQYAGNRLSDEQAVFEAQENLLQVSLDAKLSAVERYERQIIALRARADMQLQQRAVALQDSSVFLDGLNEVATKLANDTDEKTLVTRKQTLNRINEALKGYGISALKIGDTQEAQAKRLNQLEFAKLEIKKQQLAIQLQQAQSEADEAKRRAVIEGTKAQLKLDSGTLTKEGQAQAKLDSDLARLEFQAADSKLASTTKSLAQEGRLVGFQQDALGLTAGERQRIGQAIQTGSKFESPGEGKSGAEFDAKVKGAAKELGGQQGSKGAPVPVELPEDSLTIKSMASIFDENITFVRETLVTTSENQVNAIAELQKVAVALHETLKARPVTKVIQAGPAPAAPRGT